MSTVPSTSNSRHFAVTSSIVDWNSSRLFSRSRFGAGRRRRSGGKIQPFDSFDEGKGRTRCGTAFFTSCAGRATGRGIGGGTGGPEAASAPAASLSAAGEARWIEKPPGPFFSRTRSVAIDGM